MNDGHTFTGSVTVHERRSQVRHGHRIRGLELQPPGSVTLAFVKFAENCGGTRAQEVRRPRTRVRFCPEQACLSGFLEVPFHNLVVRKVQKESLFVTRTIPE